MHSLLGHTNADGTSNENFIHHKMVAHIKYSEQNIKKTQLA